MQSWPSCACSAGCISLHASCCWVGLEPAQVTDPCSERGWWLQGAQAPSHASIRARRTCTARWCLLKMALSRALQVLWLCDNPCADDPSYRSTVTRYLPQLQKLDNEDLVTGERDPHTRGPPASPSHAAMMHGGGPSRGSPASRSNSYTPEPAGIPNLTAVMHEPPPPSRGTPQRSSKNILYAVSGPIIMGPMWQAYIAWSSAVPFKRRNAHSCHTPAPHMRMRMPARRVRSAAAGDGAADGAERRGLGLHTTRGRPTAVRAIAR